MWIDIIVTFILLALVFAGLFFFSDPLIWLICLITALVAGVMFFMGRLYFTERNNLEKTRDNLTRSLDIAEERRIRAELERDRMATIINNFGDGLIIIDEKNKIFSINPAAEKILDIKANEVLEKSLQRLSDFPKARPILSVLSLNLPDVNRKEVDVEKNFTIELSVAPLSLDKNNMGRLIAIHDISREKTIERTKTEFVSLAAHQLKTPLTIIKWTVSMLKKGDFGKLTRKQDQAAKSVFQGSERLIHLVGDLLDVTRIEEGRYLYKITETDIKNIVLNVISAYKDEAKRRKIKIDFKEPGEFPKLMLDAEKIKLPVQNFIDNAIKYSPDGGKIIVSLKNDGKNIELRVQDFGIGIPKSQQGGIFSKFFRGSNATRANTVGSGLGLFLSKNIVEAHGGKMWFESDDNPERAIGTSFYFSLPIKKIV